MTSAMMYAFVVSFVPLLGPAMMDCKLAEGDKFVPTFCGCVPFMGKGKMKLLADFLGAALYWLSGTGEVVLACSLMYACGIVMEAVETFFMCAMVICLMLGVYLALVILSTISPSLMKIQPAPAFRSVFDLWQRIKASTWEIYKI